MLNLLTYTKKCDTMGTAKAQQKTKRRYNQMKKYRIQTTIEDLYITEIEIFLNEQDAKQRYNVLVQSANENGLNVEIIFDMIDD